jgi:hypothetical protein
MATPGAHPDAPPDLARRRPILFEGRLRWHRIHAGGSRALYFGRERKSRFDAPAGEYGVLYVGEDAHTAFVETFGRETGIDAVTRSALRRAALSTMASRRPLRLIDLAATGGLARIGADGRLCTGDHAISRRWSKALYVHPSKPDGILYPARHDLARWAVALFDRARRDLVVESTTLLSDPKLARLLADILDTYGFGVIEDL